jgi:inner membrane protein
MRSTVEPPGHVGTALVFATPAWFLRGRRLSLTSADFTLVTAMLPDVDLVLEELFAFPVPRHYG